MNLNRRNFLRLSLAASLSLLTVGCAEGNPSPASMTAQKSVSGLSYWLYTPQSSGTESLILYLHGGSGKGSDLDTIFSAASLPQFLRDGLLAPNAYVVVPQLPASCKSWAEKDAQLLGLISELKQRYSVSRVSLTGHSMGGTGAWDLASAHSEVFSAVAPLSGSIQTTSQTLQAFHALPVWAIVGSADTIVSPNSSIQFLQELQQENPSAKLTVLNSATHFDVPQAYLSSEFDILGWLTSFS